MLSSVLVNIWRNKLLAKFVNFKFKELPVDHIEGQHCWLSCCDIIIQHKHKGQLKIVKAKQ